MKLSDFRDSDDGDANAGVGTGDAGATRDELVDWRGVKRSNATHRSTTALAITASEFCDRAVKSNVLIIPGKVFSSRDTHFRLSFAVPEVKLERGLQALVELMADTRASRPSMAQR